MGVRGTVTAFGSYGCNGSPFTELKVTQGTADLWSGSYETASQVSDKSYASACSAQASCDLPACNVVCTGAKPVAVCDDSCGLDRCRCEALPPRNCQVSACGQSCSSQCQDSKPVAVCSLPPMGQDNAGNVQCFGSPECACEEASKHPACVVE